MKRRDFLLGGAAASALASGSSRIRIALLGGGHGHAMSVLDTVRESPDWELAGICEPDPVVMSRYAQKGVPALTRSQVLDDASIRVVAVESFVWDLAPNARAALEAGKHIHWDKPPAPSMREYREIRDLAARRGLVVQMGYMWRYSPAIKAALEAGRAGWLGDIFQVRGCINTLIDAPERKKLARFKGGEMFELGGHLIDPIVRLMGRPERVTPVLRHDGPIDDGLADNTFVLFEWRRALGTLVTASMLPRAYPHRALEIAGTGGTAVVEYALVPPALRIDLTSAAGPYKAGAQTLTYPFQYFVQDFADLAAAVRGERKLPFTAEEDLLVEETLLRACGMEG